MKPMGYERVNQDLLKTVRLPDWRSGLLTEPAGSLHLNGSGDAFRGQISCSRSVDDYLFCAPLMEADNTNADPEVRELWVKLARKHGVPIRCVLFAAPAALCQHNDAVRALTGTLVSLRPESPEWPRHRTTQHSGRCGVCRVLADGCASDESREAHAAAERRVSWLRVALPGAGDERGLRGHYHGRVPGTCACAPRVVRSSGIPGLWSRVGRVADPPRHGQFQGDEQQRAAWGRYWT